MSGPYKAVGWNRQKKIYDTAMGSLILAAILVFVVVTLLVNPSVTAETLVIRSTSLSAFVLLHVILCIGPLARLDRRFLPMLYNRRHLGVTMFCLAAVHAVFAVIQFHSAGNVNPLVSVFVSYRQDYNPFAHQSVNISHFPFEPLGFFALCILFLMAATSHDFWLHNLGASFWKAMHQLVYVAYGLIVLHVVLGVLQSERNPVYVLMLGIGFATVMGLHVAGWRREREQEQEQEQEWVDVCATSELAEGSGTVAMVRGERIAVYLHKGRIFATSNTCRHQGGPIGEGRIIDGCITCPWHGWQYRPEDGCSPPPFKEVIPTFNVRIEGGHVLVQATPNALGTKCEGAVVA